MTWPNPPEPAGAVAVWWATDLYGVVADGDPVSSWTDRVSSIDADQSTAAYRPTFDRNVMRGGRPGVTFDGTNDYLRAASTVSASEDGCVVAVVSVGVTTGYRYIWSSGDEATSFQHYLAGGIGEGCNRLIMRDGPDSVGVSRWGKGSSTTTGHHVLEWASDGSAWTLRDGNTPDTLSITYDTPAGLTLAPDGVWFADVTARDSFGIGALLRFSAVAFWQGSIGYLGVFESPLSSTDRADLYQWADRYYGPSGGFRYGMGISTGTGFGVTAGPTIR